MHSDKRKRRLVLVILLALSLLLIGGYTGRVILAQQDSGSERTEGADGETGQRDLTEGQINTLQPEGFTVLYHFAGALNQDTIKATVVQCTNVDESQETNIEVQLFNWTGTFVYTGTTTVDPMATATFESSQVVFTIGDVNMYSGVLEQGYGRILAEHENVICTVVAMDPDNDPPTWILPLPVYAGPFHNLYIPAVLSDTAP